MNTYILLDGLKYTAPHKAFAPVRSKPSTERITLSGRSDVTYGPASSLEWTGSITAPVTPRDTGWGDIDDLRYTLEKRQGLAFTDHYGNTGIVYAVGSHGETSFTPVWDAASNTFRVAVRLIVDIGGGVIVPLDTLIMGLSAETFATVGGTRTISMETLELESTLEHMFTARKIEMQTLALSSAAASLSIPQIIEMDTLTLAGSIPVMTVT
jgi:hypothetical protein